MPLEEVVLSNNREPVEPFWAKYQVEGLQHCRLPYIVVTDEHRMLREEELGMLDSAEVVDRQLAYLHTVSSIGRGSLPRCVIEDFLKNGGRKMFSVTLGCGDLRF